MILFFCICIFVYFVFINFILIFNRDFYNNIITLSKNIKDELSVKWFSL